MEEVIIILMFIISVFVVYLILIYTIKRIFKKIKMEEELLNNNLKWLKEH